VTISETKISLLLSTHELQQQITNLENSRSKLYFLVFVPFKSV